jgi:3D (Asp-Asp-Asp) domain-containing protein
MFPGGVISLLSEVGALSRQLYEPEPPLPAPAPPTTVSFPYSINGERRIATVPYGTTVEMHLLRRQRETDNALVYHGDFARPLTPGAYVPFLTWHSRFEIESLPILYTVYENVTDRVSAGRQIMRIVGEEGEKQRTTAIVYIGGVEVAREYMGTEILREAIDGILDIGTGWLGALTDVTAPDFHYYRSILMEATAYTAGYCCTNKHPWDPWYRITASGREVEHGIVAVDRTVIPLGTRLYVYNYGFAIAADVGGAIRGYKIDLFMEDLADALRFGRRHIYVWILDDIWGYSE